MSKKIDVLHPIYGIGYVRGINFDSKRAFIHFPKPDREFYENLKVIAGWFDFSLLGMRVK